MNARTAVVIGAGTIGNAIAAHLARGHDVHQASHAELELADPDSVRRYFAHFAWIDVLVNAAGSYGAIGSVRELAPQAWRAAVDVNLVGAYACCHYALPRMRAGSHIVNLAGGGKGPLERRSGYASAKAALWRLTETLAAEEPALHVNAIAPGPMWSRMQEAIATGNSEAARFARALRDGHGAVPVENTLRALDYLLAQRCSGQIVFARTFKALALAAA